MQSSVASVTIRSLKDIAEYMSKYKPMLTLFFFFLLLLLLLLFFLFLRNSISRVLSLE